jgi:prepilin-type processing-associated H-X9-DG protein
MQCTNNLKQLALASHGVHDTFGSLPPGAPTCYPAVWQQGGNGSAGGSAPDCLGPSWTVHLLAHIEQTAVSNIAAQVMSTYPQELNEANPQDNWEHAAAGGIGSFIPGKLWLCPSADIYVNKLSTWSLENLAKGNYVANFGSGTYLAYLDQNAGTFGPVTSIQKFPPEQRFGYGKGVRLTDITDGTSNTLLLSEIVAIDDQQDGRGTWILPAMGGNAFSALNGPNSTVNDVIPTCPPTWPGNSTDRLRCARNRSNGNVWASARSFHTNGVNAALADGSVRFFAETINVTVWRALGTRAGGEVIGDF